MGALFFAFSLGLNAQVSGTKTILIDYPTIQDFIIDINANGIGAGGVNLIVPSGYSEVAPSGGFVITATGTASNNITIGSVGMPKPIITASPSQASGTISDAIFKIIGGDYINIVGLDLRENTANTTTAAGTNNMTEFGIALFYGASVTDGPKNCSVINNTISLGGTYQNAFGIYSNLLHTSTAMGTSATATGVDGNANNLKIYGNTISNVNLGIVVIGANAAADHGTGVDIGGNSALTGNTITFGVNSSFSSFSGLSGTANGIIIRNNKNFNISYNSVTNPGLNAGTGTIRGIFVYGPANTSTGASNNVINNNTISILSATNATIYGVNIEANALSTTSEVSVSNNTFTALRHTGATPTSTVYAIYNQAQALTANFNGNNFTSLGNITTTGSFAMIYNSTSTRYSNVSNNTVNGGLTKAASSNTFYFYYNNGSPANGTTRINGNMINNLNFSGATPISLIYDNTTITTADSVYNNTISNINMASGHSGNFVGVYIGYGAQGTAIYNNEIFNVTGGSGQVFALNLGAGSGIKEAHVHHNSIHDLTSDGGGNGLLGINISNAGSAPLKYNIYDNKIYNLTKNSATGAVSGIIMPGGLENNVYNNLISGLYNPISTAGLGVIGINVNGTVTSKTVKVYNNTIYLSGTSSGTGFGSTGINHTGNTTSTTNNLELRNNIIINEIVPNGGVSAALNTNTTATQNNYSAASNKNLFYAGIPSASNLIYNDGTNQFQTIGAYQAFAAGKDLNSIAGESFTYGTPGSFFISLTGSSTDFLRPVAGISTQVESGADAISSPVLIDKDFSGAIRATFAGYAGTGSNPDIGAYEFEGVTPAPVIVFNNMTPNETAQCVNISRLISVDATTVSGTISTVTINYTVNGTPQTAITMVNVSGNTWEGSIPTVTPSNATVNWSVTAMNSIGISTNYIGTSYSDEPLLGLTASASAFETTICAGGNSNLTATISTTATVSTGTGASTSSASANSPFYHTYGGAKTQYIYLASELSAFGLSAGPINSLGINITALGTPTLNNFSINVGHTAQNNAITNTAILSGLNQVYSNPAQLLTTGNNTFTFSSPFMWDGISNIVISINYTNNNSGGTSSTVTMNNNVGFASTLAIFADNASASCLFNAPASGQACMGLSSNGTSSNRPNFVIVGTYSAPINSISWKDGSMVEVGTTNPLSVSPLLTTTYTADITASGCTVSPSPTVLVTVNPNPTVPTATNSIQCGTQVPTASVTSTSGASTPTFIWYDASTGGNMLQSGTSSTYTTAITSTTTFYVSEQDNVTGCESPRVAVTTTVNTADPIMASGSTTICLGDELDLEVENTNPSPVQNYTYTWTGTVNSGLETPMNGSMITITPTLAGTYTYTVNAVDGPCSNLATIDVIVNPLPATAPIVSTNSQICEGDIEILSSSIPVAPVILGTGTTAPAGTSAGNPFSAYYGGTKQQMIYLASELTAQGMVAGSEITSVSFEFFAFTAASCNDLTIRMGNTNATALTGFVGGTTTVYGPLTYTPSTTGIVTFNLTSNYVWDGVSNIIVETVHNAGNGGNGSGTRNTTTTTASNTVYYRRADNIAGGIAGFDALSTATSQGALNTRPNIRFNLLPTYPTWTPISELFTNASATISYTGNEMGTVYAKPTSTTMFVATYTSDLGCTAETTKTITVNSLPTVIAGTDQTVCENDMVTLAGSGAVSYVWNNGVVNNTAFAATGTTTYTVIGTDANGCENSDMVDVNVNTLPAVNAGLDQSVCDGDMVTLAGSGAVSYVWDNGVIDNTAFTPSGTMTYTVTGTDVNGCENSDMVDVNVNTLPTVDAGLDQTICEGDMVTLTGSGADSYVWDNSVIDNTAFTPSGTMTYTVTGTDANGCENSDMVDVNVNTLPTVNAGLDQTVCEGDMVTLTGSGADSYVWDNSVIDNTAFEASGSMTYTVIGTDANGCENSDMVDVNVNMLPTVDAGTDQTVCEGDMVTLAGSGADSYVWDNSVIDNTAFEATGSMTYTVIGTDANGCENSDMVDVNVNSLPTATVVDNGDKTLTAGTATSYVWIDCATNLPVPGATSQTFAPTEPGSYAVIVTNSSGCEDTSVCISVDDTGIKGLIDQSVEVYPNPTQGDLTIKFSAMSANVIIIDAQGKVVISETINSGTVVSLANVERGVYMLKLTSNNGSSIHRIVKN